MISHVEIISRLLLAASLGSVIGLERERLLWAAGLRTHMLVCVGACLIMIVSAFGFSDVLGTPNINLDPSRIAAQVVSGIGFLGAGAILLRGDVIRGLTTAASVWAVAGIGLTVGGGLYFAAISATFIILMILAGVKPLEEKLKERTGRARTLTLVVKRGEMSMNLLQQTIKNRTRYIKQFIIEPSESTEFDKVTITLSRINRLAFSEVIAQLQSIPSVTDVKNEDEEIPQHS